jgi:UDP-N-acetylglucosamine 2-epimerase
MTLRLATVVGARPEFVQVGSVARAIQSAHSAAIDHVLIHTGQHYDYGMSQAFFDQIGLPDPDHHLEVGSGSQGAQTGEMLIRLDTVLRKVEPDVVMVFGDTNSTLAGALAAAKQGVPVAHVESGLRSFNLAMPEEINRRLTDQLATYRFCPSENAVENLGAEGISDGVHLTGDVMHESLMHTIATGRDREDVLAEHSVERGGYVFATAHRAENTDDPDRLRQILLGISSVAQEGLPVVFPVHPRTRSRLEHGLLDAGVHMVEPVPHADSVALVEGASLVMTDSGGLQKEAYWLGTPCVTMRDETEWVETVGMGWNLLVGADRRRIHHGATRMIQASLPSRAPLYGEGTKVSSTILEQLVGASTGLGDVEAS